MKLVLTLPFVYQNEMVATIEKDYKEKSGSNLWYKYRAWKVTVSCYPEAFKFSIKACISWGCKHEKLAKDLNIQKMQKKFIAILKLNT